MGLIASVWDAEKKEGKKMKDEFKFPEHLIGILNEPVRMEAVVAAFANARSQVPVFIMRLNELIDADGNVGGKKLPKVELPSPELMDWIWRAFVNIAFIHLKRTLSMSNEEVDEMIELAAEMAEWKDEHQRKKGN